MRSLPTLAACVLLAFGPVHAAPPPGGLPPPGAGWRPPPPGPGVRPPPPPAAGWWGGGWYGGHPRYWGPRVGVAVGVPWGWAGWPAAYPYYGWGAAYGWPYAPVAPVAPVVVGAPTAPTIVVQQVPVEPPPPAYWYYCTQPAGYFPYVPNCEQPWLKVVPPTPGDAQSAPRLAP